MIDTAIKWLSETNIQAGVIAIIASRIAYTVKEKKRKKEMVNQLIQDIEDEAVKHWCAEGSDRENQARAINIQQMLKRLSKEIIKKHQEYFVDFRKAITGQNFTSPDRRAIEFEGPEIQLIQIRGKELSDLI